MPPPDVHPERMEGADVRAGQFDLHIGVVWEGERARMHLCTHTCVLNECTNQPLSEGPRDQDVSQGWDCGA